MPVRARRACWLALAMLLLAPAAAQAQEPSTSTTAPPESTSTTTVPTDPAPDTTSVPVTTAPPSTVPPATTTTRPESDTPPIPDGAELPDRPDTEPEPGDGGGPPSGGAAVAESAEETRRRIVARLAAALDPAGEARRIEAETLAELHDLQLALVQARQAYDDADRRWADADQRASRAATAADEAGRAADEASEDLERLAVAMYVDPPVQSVVRAEVLGDDADRRAAGSLLSAQWEWAGRTARRADRAERAASERAAGARAAADEATELRMAAEQRLAALERDAASHAEALQRAAAIVGAITSQLGADGLPGALGTLLEIERVTMSGSVVVDVRPDGTWSVVPVGFPVAEDLVRVPGTTIKVHRLIAAPMVAMVAAARDDGIVLDGWGHRDSLRQVELRRAHCGSDLGAVLHAPSSSCRPPTARPGRSMHERGLAVDFKDCASRSTPCYQWLSANADRFGLFNLPSEPWHWSTNGH